MEINQVQDRAQMTEMTDRDQVQMTVIVHLQDRLIVDQLVLMEIVPQALLAPVQLMEIEFIKQHIGQSLLMIEVVSIMVLNCQIYLITLLNFLGSGSGDRRPGSESLDRSDENYDSDRRGNQSGRGSSQSGDSRDIDGSRDDRFRPSSQKGDRSSSGSSRDRGSGASERDREQSGDRPGFGSYGIFKFY